MTRGAPVSTQRYTSRYFPVNGNQNQRLHEVEAERDTHVLTFTEEDLQEVMTYGHRLEAWNRHKKGTMGTPPMGSLTDVSDDLQPSPPDAMRV